MTLHFINQPVMSELGYQIPSPPPTRETIDLPYLNKKAQAIGNCKLKFGQLVYVKDVDWPKKLNYSSCHITVVLSTVPSMCKYLLDSICAFSKLS